MHIRYSYAEYGVALSRYREVLALQEELPDRSAVATTLISTGNASICSGRLSGIDCRLSPEQRLDRGATDTGPEAKAPRRPGPCARCSGGFPRQRSTHCLARSAEGRATNTRFSQGAALMNIGESQPAASGLQARRRVRREPRPFRGCKGFSSNT